VRLPISTVIMTSQRVTPADALYTVQQKISADVSNPLVYWRPEAHSRSDAHACGNRDWYVFPPGVRARQREDAPARGICHVLS
jgi:hypothetical protein